MRLDLHDPGKIFQHVAELLRCGGYFAGGCVANRNDLQRQVHFGISEAGFHFNPKSFRHKRPARDPKSPLAPRDAAGFALKFLIPALFQHDKFHSRGWETRMRSFRVANWSGQFTKP
jgi:hypothetical protein